jgi:hypothetical protein
MNLDYSINGVPFASLGIRVKDSDGVIDGLEMKEPFSVNWPDAHGQVLDLSRPRYEARTIELDCWMVAVSPEAMINQTNALITQLARPGTQRLRINATDKPLVYEVYYRGGLSIKKQWRAGAMVGEFKLKLIEPQPVKWVASAQGGTTVTLNLSALSPITLHWGDNTRTYFQGGPSQLFSHTYSGSNTSLFYLIVSGEMERVGFVSYENLEEVWTRLY